MSSTRINLASYSPSQRWIHETSFIYSNKHGNAYEIFYVSLVLLIIYREAPPKRVRGEVIQPIFLKPPFIFLFNTQWTEFQSPRDTDRYWGKHSKLFRSIFPSFLCEFVDANYTLTKKSMPLGYCCFRSILCWRDFLLPLLHTQNAPVEQEKIYQADFKKKH